MSRKPARGGVIASVEPGSAAAAAGLRAGDRVLAANGRALRDVLDYQFHAGDGAVALLVESDGQRRLLKLSGDESLGIVFEEPTFDGIRRCNNRCSFCFVPQNPPGARPSLFVKDDDYRYSVLYGAFVTLTNLDEADWERIAEQRLSPLNVSVHATETHVRRRLLGNPRAPDIVEQLRRLIDAGVRVNAQVVLCPGLNDGVHLDQTIADLAALYPGVQTLSVVPVGLTDNGIRRVRTVRQYSAEEARAVLRGLRAWRRRFRRQRGVSFVHASDEFYLLAGLAVPSARHYDGFPQLGNGVGMVRRLLDEAARLRRRRPVPRSRFRRVTAVSGTLAAPVLTRALTQVGNLTQCEIKVVAAENRYFGPSVTVAGLLTAGDVLAALEGSEPGDLVLLPRHTLDASGTRLLDDVTPDQLERELARPVRFAGTLGEAWRELSRAPDR